MSFAAGREFLCLLAAVGLAVAGLAVAGLPFAFGVRPFAFVDLEGRPPGLYPFGLEDHPFGLEDHPFGLEDPEDRPFAAQASQQEYLLGQ